MLWIMSARFGSNSSSYRTDESSIFNRRTCPPAKASFTAFLQTCLMDSLPSSCLILLRPLRSSSCTPPRMFLSFSYTSSFLMIAYWAARITATLPLLLMAFRADSM